MKQLQVVMQLMMDKMKLSDTFGQLYELDLQEAKFSWTPCLVLFRIFVFVELLVVVFEA